MIAYFFDFDGRLGRVAFWRRNFYLCVATALIAVMIAAVGLNINSSIPMLIAAIFLLPLFFASSISISVRRLHDRGRSGLWMLLYLPLRLSTFADFQRDSGRLEVLMLVGLHVLALWPLIDLGFLKSVNTSENGSSEIAPAVGTNH